MLQEKGYDVTIGDFADAPSQEQLVEALKSNSYDAVVTFLTDAVDKTLFEACPTAKLFANYAVGFNNMNIEDAKAYGVTLTNTPGCAGKAVAEHTVALMLSVLMRIPEGDRYIRAGSYSGWKPDLLIGGDLTGKTVGLIGLGDIGSQVARMLAKGFSCKILYTDIKPNEALDYEIWSQFVSKEELLKQSDIISLHVPLLPSTKHLINKDTIAEMKDGVVIINTARGPVIDELALIESLRSQKIKGAGLDVFEFEPHISEELISIGTAVLTPHIASARESVRIRMSEIVAENVISYVEHGKAINQVTVN